MANDWMWALALNNNNSTTTNAIPDWLTDASKTGVNYATKLLNSPTQPYTGPLTAGMNADQIAAGDKIKSNYGSANAGFSNAQDLINKSTGKYLTVTPDTFKNGLSNISAYMNPYVSGVVDVAAANGAKALANNLNSLKGSAISSGSGYGSRQGVQEGAAAADNALNQQNYIYKAMSDAYGMATGLLGKDIENKLTADTTNATNNENYMDNLLAAGIATANNTNAAKAATNSDIESLMQYGTLAQNTENASNMAKYQEWLRQQGAPYQALQLYNQTVQGAPKTTTSSTNSTGWSMNPQQNASSNPWMTGLGYGLAGANMFAAPANGTSAATGLFNAAKTGLAMLPAVSDRSMKTDIQKLGKDEETGLDIYSYRYKGDPKTYPKVVGPMAQDIEKNYPGTTKRKGNRLTVDGYAFNALAGKFAGGEASVRGML